MERFRNISKNTILAFALSIAFQILLGNYVVDGNSMDPTLRNDQRVFVVSEGGFIDKGSSVNILSVDGNRIVVRKIN